ncbi:MAG: hypothetical protein ACYTGH_13650, partial [Planctomycetota bacterium]
SLILVPTVAIAFFRLRTRNLAVLFEAEGWALNIGLPLRRRQAQFFTQRPDHPEGFYLPWHKPAKRVCESVATPRS